MSDYINLSEYSTKRLKQMFYGCIVVMLFILVIGYRFIFETADYHGLTLARFLVGVMLTAFGYIFGVWFESILSFMSRIKAETRGRKHAAIDGSMGDQDPLNKSNED